MENQELRLPTEADFDVEKWHSTVTRTLESLKASTTQYMWPRDLVLQYLQLMECLQVDFYFILFYFILICLFVCLFCLFCLFVCFK